MFLHKVIKFINIHDLILLLNRYSKSFSSLSIQLIVYVLMNVSISYNKKILTII